MHYNSSAQTQKATDSMTTRRGKLMLFLKGVAMGLGDSVPGISGGTIAVITKIYDQLVFSICAVDLRACALLFTGQFKAFWKHINGTFLLVLALGNSVWAVDLGKYGALSFGELFCTANGVFYRHGAGV